MFASAERYDCSPPIKAESLSTEECKHRAYSLVPSHHSPTLELIQYVHIHCLLQDAVVLYISISCECKSVRTYEGGDETPCECEGMSESEDRAPRV